MIKIDLHTHALPISKCSKLTCRELIDLKIKQGYGGMVLTDHCLFAYYSPMPYKEYVEEVIQVFNDACEYGKKYDFIVFLGLEVTIQNPYGDWLLYGVTEEFLRGTPPLSELSQKELYEVCKEANVLMVAAHPFRGGEFSRELPYMDGVELNCFPTDYEKRQQVFAFGKEKGFLLTCGTDCHGEDERFCGGILIPKSIKNSVELAEYIKTTKLEKALVFEPSNN